MGDLHDGYSLLVQSAEEFHNLLGLARVKVARRLVGQQERRLVNYGAGDSHQLLLASRELARVQILLGNDLKAIQRVGHKALPLAARNVLVREREIDVFLNGEIVEQVNIDLPL